VFKSLKKLIDSQAWLDTVGDPLQKLVNDVFANAGPQGKQVQDFLNGKWLGHPVHPMVTDVPVGAWTCTMALDTIGAIRDDEGLQRAADVTLGIGLAAGLASAVTGLTDWKDTYGDERKLGLLHGLTMIATVTVYSAALSARLAGGRKAGVALANLGYALVSAGAYLGGDEVYDLGYPINHTAFLFGPTEYTRVIADSDLQPDKPTKADANGVPILLVRHQGRVYALDDTCVHAGCSLAGGTLEGRSIICPCHGSQYDLANGSVMHGPATMPEPSYHVRVVDGNIEVKLAAD
jgi:nitrite reductase/ring-hydroxylating ferredoxin subunit/uncharacterized membrane protein